MEYKTPEIENLMKYISEIHPKLKDGLARLEKEAASISLCGSEEGREAVEHAIVLATGEVVYLRWDVEYLVNYSLLQPERLRLGSPYEIVNTVGAGNSCVLHKGNSGCVVALYEGAGTPEIQRSVSYVIVATLPCMNTRCIMDGNHGFYESMIENKMVRYFPISGEECMVFLQPESRKFVELCKEIEKLVVEW